jgi:hypothetical protein
MVVRGMYSNYYRFICHTSWINIVCIYIFPCL